MSKRDHGPQSLTWWNGLNPTNLGGTSNIFVGGAFQLQANGRLFGIRAFRSALDSQQHWGFVVDPDTLKLLAATRFYPTVIGSIGVWQNAWLRPAVVMPAGQLFYVIVAYPHGQWMRVSNALPTIVNRIEYWNGFQGTNFDVTAGGWTLNTNANGVDVLVQFD